MSKRKKILILTISIVFVAALTVIATFGVRAYQKSHPKFTVKDTLPDGNGKKATVILLGGQSNAAGCSRDDYLKMNVTEEKYAEYSAGYDNVYINYYVSGNAQSNEFVKCATLQGEPGGYFGPELGLAEKLSEAHPDELFFIIKYTWSGTALFDCWLSPSSDGKTGDLYNAFVGFVESSIKYLVSKDYEVSIEGMCWMQGESDSFSVEHATDYEIHLSNFIKDLRKEFDRYASNDGIAFVDAYIAENPMYWVYCDLVNQSKTNVAGASDINVVVDTVGEGLSCSAEPADAPDNAHYDSLSEIKLGHLFAAELERFFD